MPREIDEEIARLKLATMGVNLTELSEEQAAYLGSRSRVPTSPISTRPPDRSRPEQGR